MTISTFPTTRVHRPRRSRHRSAVAPRTHPGLRLTARVTATLVLLVLFGAAVGLAVGMSIDLVVDLALTYLGL